MRPTRIVAVALFAALIIWSEATAADINVANVEGWHTWQVDEAGPLTEMCCFTGQQGSRSQKGCNLDGGRMSYGNNGDCATEAGHAQFYALIKNGRPAKIRVLSSQCPVTSNSTIADHGIVSTKDNIRWFRSVIEDKNLGQGIKEEALFGLVQSESDTAYDYIDSLLSRR